MKVFLAALQEFSLFFPLPCAGFSMDFCFFLNIFLCFPFPRDLLSCGGCFGTRSPGFGLAFGLARATGFGVGAK